MRRPAQLAATQPLPKPVSVASPRNLALATRSAVAVRRGPVMARVRDSLVLRVVVKKSASQSAAHERRAH